MRKKSLVFKPSGYSILYLGLCCLLVYMLKDSGTGLEHKVDHAVSSGIVYVEIAEEDGFPIVLKLRSDSEPERLAKLYSLPRKPANGDRIVFDDHGAASLSRISGRKNLSLGVPIGINSASATDLVELPGIGPKLAERIIEHKDLNSNFQSVDELSQIRGIGTKKLRDIMPLINLD